MGMGVADTGTDGAQPTVHPTVISELRSRLCINIPAIHRHVFDCRLAPARLVELRDDHVCYAPGTPVVGRTVSHYRILRIWAAEVWAWSTARKTPAWGVK